MINYQEKLQHFDTTAQYQTLVQFPDHFAKGIEIGAAADVSGIDVSRISNIVLCGMGGSAIGADILRSYVSDEITVPIIVNRTYMLPAFVGKNSLVIAISYSGNTEETLFGYNQALERGAQVVALTSGGKIAEESERNGNLVMTIPGGLAPRYALGYLFPPLLQLFAKLGLVPDKTNDLNDTLKTVSNAITFYKDYDAKANDAIQIAEALHGMLPVIYSPLRFMEPVNLRWRNQISENSKMLAYGNVFPEMNHNEIVGWEQNPELLQRATVIVMHENSEGPRVSRRIRVTLDLIRPFAGRIIEVYAEEECMLARMFGLICLGDWISFYLAIGTDTDPYPIEKIDLLKKALTDN